MKPKAMADKDKQGAVINNRKARHDYQIIETMEAGISLQGSEVKSLRLGKANLRDGYARVDKGEVFLYNVHISPYDKASYYNHEAKRPRKLLLHKREINRLMGLSGEGLYPGSLKVYLPPGAGQGRTGPGPGNKKYDKRGHCPAGRPAGKWPGP